MSACRSVLLVVLLSVVMPARVAAATLGTFAEVQELLAQCQAAYHRLEDYRGTLRRESKGASEDDVIEVVFRKPTFLFLRWQAGVYKGTTLLTRPDRGRGDLWVTLGEWFSFVSARIAATEVSEPFVPSLKDVSEWLAALVSLAQRPPTDRSLRLVELRTGDVTLGEGRVLLLVPAFLIPFRDDAVSSYEFVIEQGTGMPLELSLRGAGGEIRQRLTYTDLQVNVGVSLQTFQVEDQVEGGPISPRVMTVVDLRGFVQNWQRRYGEIADYTGVWVTEERGAAGLVRRRAEFKFRKPFDLYLLWGAEGVGAREALFRRGWNGERVRVYHSFWGLPLIGDIRPDSSLARRGSHYPLSEFGLNRVVERLQDQLVRGWLQGEVEIRWRGVQDWEGQPCYVLEFVFPPSVSREYRHHYMITYWQIPQRLLVKYDAFDWRGQLDERHEFRQLHVNVSLNDTDFDAANPQYGFLLFRQAPQLDRFLTGRE